MVEINSSSGPAGHCSIIRSLSIDFVDNNDYTTISNFCAIEVP